MPNGAKHWCFTWNNYTSDDVTRLSSLDVSSPSAKVSYLIFGKEVSTTGTPHLQGFVSFTRRLAQAQAKTVLGGDPHLEVCRSIRHSIKYCGKDDQSPVVIGTPPLDQSPSARNEYALFIDTVRSGVRDCKILRETHPNVMARYPRYASAVLRDHEPKTAPPLLSLRPWQQFVLEYLSADVNPREIGFAVDTKGNSGKSYLCSLIEHQLDDVQVMRPGKFADMALEYNPITKVLLIDIPRCKLEHFQYDFLECVKDGRLFSPKYDSHMKRFIPPHVFVFMNETPDMTKLSDDRYVVIYTQNPRSLLKENK